MSISSLNNRVRFEAKDTQTKRLDNRGKSIFFWKKFKFIIFVKGKY